MSELSQIHPDEHELASLREQLRAMQLRIDVDEALERIRQKTLGMEVSTDIAGVTAELFEELQKLGLPTLRCGIGLVNETEDSGEIWTSTRTAEGDVLHTSGRVSLLETPERLAILDAWKRKEKCFSFDLAGKDLIAYLKPVYPDLNIRSFNNDFPYRQFINVFMFKYGGLFAISRSTLSPNEKWIAERFAQCFELAYTRFRDLKLAEARARDALHVAALHRIRAEIASMRKSKDLENVTPLIWQELSKLDIPFFRCGVFIFDAESHSINAYLTYPDGTPFAALSLPLDSNPLFGHIHAAWQTNKTYVEYWSYEDFSAWRAYIEHNIKSAQAESYLKVSAPQELVLQFVPFAYGMLYVGSESSLTENHIEIINSIAHAFAVAYARYLDFTELEKKNIELSKAKKRVEETLENLKKTQQQLIHSEKMASLGKLTSGIAHELQNPLNFVNNFALMNQEITTELEQAIYNTAATDTGDLIRDLKENAERIRLHGERADSIIKRMLQHTPGTESRRRTIDLNRLVDEYIYLSLLRLRHSKTPFEIQVKRNFDASLRPVELIPNEIGQVLMNLCSNAFDAMNEKAAASLQGYEPLLHVETKQLEKSVGIRITDNGVGIPQTIRDSIFEPFFTTKPTGSGCGLGLSLCHDIIIQGHSGRLSVTSEPGVGATFTIRLPS